MRTPVFCVEDDSDEEDDGVRLTNVVVVGTEKSGKSSIITRLVHGTFTLCYTPTKNIEIYPPVQIGQHFYKFYEIPYLYDFQHKWFLEAHVVFIVDEICADWWEKFLNAVDPKHYIEVYFITQKDKNLKIHREYKVNALEFSGFSGLMFQLEIFT